MKKKLIKYRDNSTIEETHSTYRWILFVLYDYVYINVMYISISIIDFIYVRFVL